MTRLTLFASIFLACAGDLPLEGRSCPCVQGYECCKDLCIPAASQCEPDSRTNQPDGGSRDAPVKEPQPKEPMPDPTDCAAPLSCTLAPGTVCITGRVTTFLSDTEPPHNRSRVGSDSNACARVFNPVELVSVGESAALGVATHPYGSDVTRSTLDDCGRFAIREIPRASTSAFMVIIDDCADSLSGSMSGAWATTGVGMTQPRDDTTYVDMATHTSIPVISRAMATHWNATVGHDLGADGAVIACFRGDGGQPAARVVPDGQGYTNATNTFYFAEDLANLTFPTTSESFAEGTTSATGCALVSPAALTSYTGVSAGAAWEFLLAGGRSGIYLVHRFTRVN